MPHPSDSDPQRPQASSSGPRPGSFGAAAQAVHATIRLRGQAPGGPGEPRREAAQHIDNVLRQHGTYGEPTVGRDVSETIRGIRFAAKESGSHSVHEAFMDPALTPAYLARKSDRAAADAGHRAVATRERAGYWVPEHGARPSAATSAAVGVHEETRVRLTKMVGAAVDFAESAHAHSAGQQDQFWGHGGPASALPPAPTHTQRPPTQEEINAHWAAQQRQQQQRGSQQQR
ncbi:hypothetical protein [Streptomyces sp. NPDC127119]|uniref:hypothetical protein n=1 Tax=Streptomyces sp. NPDC127119 TaxID=3345370 RepID=UPI00363833E9